jgi:hypothetical protein
MASRNHWQVREVARQMDAALFERKLSLPAKTLNRIERIAPAGSVFFQRHLLA